MSYETIDSRLSSWGIEKGFRWFTEYKNEEVRAGFSDFTGDARGQIAVDLPRSGHTIVRAGFSSGVWRRSRSAQYPCKLEALETALDKAYEQVEHWISEENNG